MKRFKVFKANCCFHCTDGQVDTWNMDYSQADKICVIEIVTDKFQELKIELIELSASDFQYFN